MKQISEATWAAIIAAVMSAALVVGIGVVAWASVEMTDDVTKANARVKLAEKAQRRVCPVKADISSMGARIYIPLSILGDADQWGEYGCATKVVHASKVESMEIRQTVILPGYNAIPVGKGWSKLPHEGASVSQGFMPTSWPSPRDALILTWGLDEA